MRKRILSALSHALEDEIGERCEAPVLFGGFQQVRHLMIPLPRWQELARSARAVVVFVEDPPAHATRPDDGIRVLRLPPEAPMRWEWVVVAADTDFGVVLSAWEIPGQEHTRDRDRVFELVWSLECAPIRVAAHACALVATRAGLPDAEDLVSATPERDADLRTAGEVFNRVLARIDSGG